MSFYTKLFNDFKKQYLGYATLVIIFNSCLGGATAMVILKNGQGFGQMVQLFLAVAACMWYNTTILADLKPKIVFNSLIVSVLICTTMLLYNIIILL